MEIPMCDICFAEPDDLIYLPEDASCLHPHGARALVPKGSFVCPEHRPISYLEKVPCAPRRDRKEAG